MLKDRISNLSRHIFSLYTEYVKPNYSLEVSWGIVQTCISYRNPFGCSEPCRTGHSVRLSSKELADMGKNLFTISMYKYGLRRKHHVCGKIEMKVTK